MSIILKDGFVKHENNHQIVHKANKALKRKQKIVTKMFLISMMKKLLTEYLKVKNYSGHLSVLLGIPK